MVRKARGFAQGDRTALDGGVQQLELVRPTCHSPNISVDSRGRSQVFTVT